MPGLSPGHTFESWYLASGTEAAGVSVDVPPSRSPGRHQTSTTVTVVDCNAVVTMARLSSRASVSGDLGGTPSRQRQQEAELLGFRAPPQVCVFITVVPITNMFTLGEGDSGGHVLRETTSLGLCGLVHHALVKAGER